MRLSDLGPIPSKAFRLVLLLLVAAGFSVAAHSQKLTTIHAFTSTPDGANPFQSNLLNVNGTLYGTTGYGGTYNFGTIFKIEGTGKETVLYSFTGGTDGALPSAGLVRDKSGNLYGTTFNGGDDSCVIVSGVGCGVVYKFGVGGLTVLYTFTGGTDGAWPQGVILDSAGNVYGPAFFGGSTQTCPFGSIGCGVIFKVTPQGNETVLYSFQGGTDGGEPNGFITMDAAENIYGATVIGGNLEDCSGPGCGVVFKLDKTGKETPLYTFAGGTDGAGPSGGFLFDAQGNLYGTAYAGGDLSCSNQSSVGCGVVYKITPAGREFVIHTFKGPDGANPSLGFVADTKGNGYSTTIYGGADNFGTAFEVTNRGQEMVLHSFTGGSDGAYPQSGLILDASGNLYSNTVEGGDLSCGAGLGCGTVFKLAP
ncbi:MAG: choice-of-anchor tandem repeat GloVer-containing protein [Terriglobales bacterium]|jgi:uncharacterized repeat protein (TIGR03803 family)